MIYLHYYWYLVINYSSVLPFHLTTNDELDTLYHVAKNIINSWYNTITVIEKCKLPEDNDDQSIISKVDHDLNIYMILMMQFKTLVSIMTLVHSEVLLKFKQINYLFSMPISSGA